MVPTAFICLWCLGNITLLTLVFQIPVCPFKGLRHLNIAKEGFTQASLGLLANQRKRQLLIGLLKSLRTIKTLQRTDVRLSEMLEEEDYPGAIQLCLECQKAASTFKHYSCISELNSKLQDTLEQIEEQLDVALSKICKNFDINHYTKVQQAYRLLGKTQTAMDQLHMHFTQAIHNTVFQVVLGYVELCAENTDTKFQKLQYKDLCTEFKFLEQSRSPSVSPSKQPSATSSKPVTLFEQYCSGGNPFEIQANHKDEETEDVLASNGYESDEQEKSAYQEYDSDSDVPEELKRDYVDEQTGDVPVKSCCPSVKYVLRSIVQNKVGSANFLAAFALWEQGPKSQGKYMQMMTILKPIAFDVIHCMSQLFDYYLYAIYTFFGRNDSLESTGLGLSSSRLRTTLNRIQESLIDLEVSADPTATLTAAEERKEKVPSPHLNQLVILTSGDTLYGLAERVVATESLVFLAEQFEFLQPHLDAVMPAAKKPFLQQFYSQEFEQFNKRLNEVSKRVRIPLPVSNILWEHCIRLANRTIVEGYANVKKCSNEGRALMQLDFQQFLTKLEKLTDIRPIPDKEFVETYIKAYYLTENDMERWIKEHRRDLQSTPTTTIISFNPLTNQAQEKPVEY
ncbi:VPS50 EARP/GARPII complex subunit [Cricetulus griseus]